MGQSDKLKEVRAALNARLFLLFIGIMMVANSITSTGRNGLNWLSLANMVTEEQGKNGDADTPEKPSAAEASESEIQPETEPDIDAVMRQMDEIGITAGDLKLIGILCLIAAVFEVVVGLVCALFSNRVDKSGITLRAVIALLLAECVCQIILAVKGAVMMNSLVYSLILPLILLWAALKMRKLAKADPDRVYAVKQSRQQARQAAPVKPAPKKSLKDRALMNAPEETEEDEPAVDGAETSGALDKE